MESISLAEARRIALAAQGFGDRPHVTPTLRTLSRTVERTGVLQIDSVNVLQRAHYLPLYSRMGPYSTDLLTRATAVAPRRLVEYWAHVAAFMPVELWPVMQHRMRAFEAHPRYWQSVRERPEVLAQVREGVRQRGPVTARDLDDGAPRSRQHWGWNWSKTKDALEFLFFSGEVAIAGRNSAFERLYDLPERVLPAEILRLPVPSKSEADRELVRRAASSHGIATLKCLADYYRMSVANTRAAVRDLVDSGDLIEVVVPGWSDKALLASDAKHPRRVRARALLSPFDPVVWERARAEALFGFRYRIEIYVPEPQRQYGYYVLPFLLGDRIVARLDLKADRARRVLLVHSAYAEAHAPEETAHELAQELWRLAGWLKLSEIEVAGRGDLAAGLAVAVARADAHY